MVLSEVRKPTDAVVAVSEDLNPQLVILLQDEGRAREAVCTVLNYSAAEQNIGNNKNKIMSAIETINRK